MAAGQAGNGHREDSQASKVETLEGQPSIVEMLRKSGSGFGDHLDKSVLLQALVG